ncbi:MAG: twitching motility protein PilT [Planctomycetota bacterium]|nr:MAG: twitching motility protein PilT [Planctomycetota bacterium]
MNASTTPLPDPADGHAWLLAVLRLGVERHASDIHLVPGEWVRLRIEGALRVLEGSAVPDAATLEAALLGIAAPALRGAIRTRPVMDYRYRAPWGSWFRVSTFRERRGLAASLRVLPARVPSLEQLGVDRHILRVGYAPPGLVLFAGHAGAGKTTTLTATLQQLLRRHDWVVHTVENPIETVLTPGRGALVRREVGRHCANVRDGIEEAMAQEADAIVIGDLREADTIHDALRAAETGARVFATVHAYDTERTIARLVDCFPPERRQAVRLQLATALRLIVSQTLVPLRSGGRSAATEIAFGGPALAALIREGREHEVATLLEAGGARGMHTLDQRLAELLASGRLEPEVARARAVHPETIGRRHAETE